MDKKTLRKEFLKLRAEIGAEVRKRADVLIASRTEELEAYRNSTLVAGYVTDGTEPDVLPVLRDALRRGKKACLPKWDGEKYVMSLVAETDINRLAPGKWGLLEPLDTKSADPETEGALFLVPGVAFDDSFARLGRGGGIYDRLLKQWGGASAAGIFYECQRSPDSLPAEEHDVKMDWIVTESALRKKR